MLSYENTHCNIKYTLYIKSFAYNKKDRSNIMDEEQYSISQTILSKICGVSVSTISRTAAKLDFKSDLIKGQRAKYNLEQSRNILQSLKPQNIDILEKVQVFFNFKGGTGKTSLCHQVATHLAILGYRVLAVDCDPQAHLTNALGIEEGGEQNTLYDIIVNSIPVQDSIKKIYPGLDLIPSDISLTRIELQLNQVTSREKVLFKVIQPLKSQYDFIFIDTNPTISILNQNTTYCADVINIVCETQPFSLKGLEILVRELESFSIAMEKKINYRVIPNKYESKTGTSQETLGILRMNYSNIVMESLVRRSEDVNISAKLKIPIYFFCKKSSMAFEDMCDLSLAILNKALKNKEV